MSAGMELRSGSVASSSAPKRRDVAAPSTSTLSKRVCTSTQANLTSREVHISVYQDGDGYWADAAEFNATAEGRNKREVLSNIKKVVAATIKLRRELNILVADQPAEPPADANTTEGFVGTDTVIVSY